MRHQSLPGAIPSVVGHLLRRVVAIFFTVILSVGIVKSPADAQPYADGVDTALVISVDVSNSVDDHRYRLQMEGIAAALEDAGVIRTILNGPRSSILVTLVTWSDRPNVAMPWMRIGSEEDAKAVAQKVRQLPRFTGEFTCLGTMLRFLNDKILPQVPVNALRTVVDVSGDGADNCNAREPVTAVRDEIASFGTTINGLPILEGSEAVTLEDWYRDNVKAGPGSFILPADGFEDFGRAIRQKFIVEISGIENSHRPPLSLASRGRRDIAR
ncbi:tRNA delta(2)-isopentenylpyrophosphate transferase (modular protein) [Candidatus Filomicrobium marinum]|uniref:tRNA delta(2)-isopentenylpyrophosphate transferase (Modular protein) n=1 Tax=Candidatus Filomicrobium marinum TaxID=1608628 RepID=A0A0D6JB53_9HYPH|nr:DUF1194 domain-containing protein [Candidatus Filomicrobium marinum]CFX03701.1 tRNA delta(2)-isopentenylpyrophosphate transferase (modular protein) [Candidatus Filomicrobium marinum]CPR15902.1 tRNA delta(2)-isopentenylpyrophosphate transferase (modular protein) [Candidatus Filomicrobium marinum]